MEGRADLSSLSSELCRVCGTPAQVRYFDVILCHACRQFFHRTRTEKEVPLKCNFDNHCTITANTRHTCTACRLEKCLAVGLKPYFRPDRSSRSAKIETEVKPRSIMLIPKITEVTSLPSLSTVFNSTIVPLHLLEHDHSFLQADQWTLLSNLIHSFDEHSVLPTIERFIREHEREDLQTYNADLIPIYIDLFQSVMSSVRSLIEANRDFYLLESNDRLILTRRVIENLSPMTSGLTIQLTSLRSSSFFWNAFKMIYGEEIYTRYLRFVEYFRTDIELHKLALAPFSFSTCYTSVTPNESSIDLSNIKTIINIQDMYAELIWRYLLYKYPREQAAIRFMNLIQVFLFALPILVEMKSHVPIHVQLIDSLVEQSEIALVLDDAERESAEI